MKYLLALVLLFAALPVWAASCAVSEYANMVVDQSGRIVPVPGEPRIATNPVTYTSSTGGNAFNAQTRFIGIRCSAKAHYRVSLATAGTNATAADMYVLTDELFFIGVPVGGLYLIEFYDGST